MHNHAAMKHLYIFDLPSKSANNGIGTYIKQLVEMVRSWKDFQVSMIMLQANTEIFFVGHYKGIEHFFFPKSSSAYYQDTAEEVCSALGCHIDDSKETIFLLNYAPCEKLLAALKKTFPESTNIFVIHDMSWTKPFMGNVDAFKVFACRKDKAVEQEKLWGIFLREKEQFAIADKVVCLCEDTQDLLATVYQVPKEKIFLIPNGIKAKRSLPLEAKRRIRKAKHIDDEIILLSVGRISKPKGFFDYLEAFKKLLDHGYNVRWVIAGDLCNAPPFLKKAGNAITKITLTGILEADELYQWYQIADIGIIPSYFEQFGYAGLEMMINELPIVASDGFGVRCMFSECENALVATLGEGETCYQEMLFNCTAELLKDESLQKRFKKNGLLVLKERYNRLLFEQEYMHLLI